MQVFFIPLKNKIYKKLLHCFGASFCIALLEVNTALRALAGVIAWGAKAAYMPQNILLPYYKQAYMLLWVFGGEVAAFVMQNKTLFALIDCITSAATCV